MVASSLSKPILLAVPDEWKTTIENFLEKENFSLLTANTKEDALITIQSQQLSAVVLLSDWAMDTSIGLIEKTVGKIPTITIISKNTFQQYGNTVFETVYHQSTLQDYCTVPFSPEELIGRLRTIISKANRSI